MTTWNLGTKLTQSSSYTKHCVQMPTQGRWLLYTGYTWSFHESALNGIFSETINTSECKMHIILCMFSSQHQKNQLQNDHSRCVFYNEYRTYLSKMKAGNSHSKWSA